MMKKILGLVGRGREDGLSKCSPCLKDATGLFRLVEYIRQKALFGGNGKFKERIRQCGGKNFP